MWSIWSLLVVRVVEETLVVAEVLVVYWLVFLV
jgi:hypothetical protein